jgi:uncharacterized protein (TIGR03118 family)
MKKHSNNSRVWATLLCAAIITGAFSSCDKNDDPAAPAPTIAQNFQQVNLVASSATFAGARVDPNFINGWGIAFGGTGTAWISSTGTNTSVVYNATGAQVLAAVTIPSPTAATGGIPTGQVFNGGTGFVLPNGNPGRFIFAGIDGVISAWNTGGAAVKMVDRSGTSVYTGLAIAPNGGSTYLYAADFKSGKIDAFDQTFALQTLPFTDPNAPAGYSPFNIQAVGTQLYVTYAKPDPATGTEQRGAGLGYVNIFNTDGSFVKRFVSQGQLNAPWGIAKAPAGFVDGGANNILVGNFGDGRINAYDSVGNYLGDLRANGAAIVVEGLWGISFAPATATTVDQNWLFFAAGPGGETQGLYGYIKKN